MTIATKITTHFGVTTDGEIKTFCGTDKMGAGEAEDKYTTESDMVNCYKCRYEMDRVARYALSQSHKLPKYVRGLNGNGSRATW